jgi:hypothetical protein
MPVDVKIIVTDALPLITLAAANCLDYLLFPALPVIIPDAVFFEATNAAGKLGAQEILDWYRAHMDAVRVEPTEAFATAQLAARVARRTRNLGEQAALEVIRNYPLAQHERALAQRRPRHRAGDWIDPDRLILLATWDYLRQLEEAQRIQSADAVIEAVRAAGRNPPTFSAQCRLHKN